MFPGRYFPATYYPTRFFAKVGAAAAAFVASIWHTLSVPARVRTVVVLPHERTVTVPRRARNEVVGE